MKPELSLLHVDLFNGTQTAEDGTETILPVLSVSLGELTLGTIIFTSPDDILTLADHIGSYCRQNNIPSPVPVMQPNSALPVIAGFLADCVPATPSTPADTLQLMTSSEIAQALADIVDLEVDEVADCMISLGYRIFRSDFKIGWGLERKE